MRSMEQVQNSMLELMQLVMSHQSESSARKGEGTGESDFHKLMEQTRDARPAAPEREQVEQKDAPETPAPKGEQKEEDGELEQQMALAAVAALQNPVVPIGQTLSPAMEQAPVDGVELLPEGQLPTQQGTTAETNQGPVIGQSGEAGSEAAAQLQAPVEQTAAPEGQMQQSRQESDARPQTEGEAEIRVISRSTDESEQPVQTEAPVFRELESTPIKVGEAPRTEGSAAAADVEQQVGSKLHEAIQSGETRVEIQLDPANLGKVSVELTVREDGGLHISLKAENSLTRSLLERDAASLQTLLGRDSGQEVRVEIEAPQSQPRQELYDQQRQGGQQQREQEQQQQRQEQPREEGQDFLHQLRLGLVPGSGLN